MLQMIIETFFSFKAYVMLPIIIFFIALAVRLTLKQSLVSSVEMAVGFAGVFIAFDFFVSNIQPAVEQLSIARGLDFPVLDVGWPPLAAITWATPLAAISIPLVIILNILMLASGLTRTIYIDIWNYWHLALVGALVMNFTGNIYLGLTATLIIAIYVFKMVEWSAPEVEREMGLKGVSASPVSVNGIVPYTVVVDWLLDRIPYIKNIEFNPEKKAQEFVKQDNNSLWSLLSEPMFIGVLMGLLLAIAADYDLKSTLELAVHIAAVMFILPKSATLIGEALMPITKSLRFQVESRFPKKNNLVVAMDTGFLMGHKSVIVTGLILMACAILIALIMPGNKVLPLGDLPNLISVMSLSVLFFRGNVFRAVIAGIPIIITFLLISTQLSPLFTELASQTGAFEIEGAQSITAFTDGGHHVRFILYYLFQGEFFAILLCGLLLGSMFFTRRRYLKNISNIAELN